MGSFKAYSGSGFTTPGVGKLKVWNGSSFIHKPMFAYTGSGWELSWPITMSAPGSFTVQTNTTNPSTDVDVSWATLASEEIWSQWEIERCGDSSGSPDGNWSNVETITNPAATNHTEGGHTGGVTYWYRMRAAFVRYGHTANGTYTSAQSVTMAGGVTPPASCQVTQNGTYPDTRLNIDWVDMGTDEDGFKVYRNDVDNQSTATLEHDTGAPNVEYWVDNTGELEDGKTYYYWVVSYDTNGNSSPTSDSNHTELTAVTDLAAAPRVTDPDNAITLTWTHTSPNNADNVKVYKSDIGSPYSWGTPVNLPGTDVQYHWTGLDPNTQYWFKVIRTNSVAGDSPDSNIATDTTDYADLSALTPTWESSSPKDWGGDDDSILLDWTTLTGATFYEVYWSASTMSGDPIGNGTKITPDPTVSNYIHDTGGTNRTRYYQVRGGNPGDGQTNNYSNFSTEAAGTSRPQPPAKPINQSASQIGPNSIRVYWTDDSTDETHFYATRYQRPIGGSWGFTGASFSPVTTQDEEGTGDPYQEDENGLTQGYEYFYGIQSYKAGVFSSYANTGVVTLEAPPTSPSSCTVSRVTGQEYDRLKVDWVCTADNEDGYKIERSLTGDSGWGEVHDTNAPDVYTWTDTGLNDGKRYYYRVWSYNSAGNSSASAGDNEYTWIDPPSNFQADNPASNQDTRIDLSWTDNSDTETFYDIQQSDTSSTGPWSDIVNSPVTAPATSEQATSLSPSTQYWFQIRNRNSIDTSPWIGPATETTFATPPGQPTNLQATWNNSQSRVELTWTDQGSNEEGYKIERADGANPAETDWAQIDTTTNDDYYYDTSAGLSGNDYTYRIRAYNEGGSQNGPYSNEAYVNCVSPPSAPSGLTVVWNDISSSLDLDWTDNSNNETGFKIWRSIDGGGYSHIYTTAANAESYSDGPWNELDDGKYCCYYVTATNSAGDSSATNTDCDYVQTLGG